jgi:3-chloro-4-hydroxyphenylacetate reductive dehalogenase
MTSSAAIEKILLKNIVTAPYPMEKLKRVDTPTTLITDSVKRVPQSENGFRRAARGDFGESAVREMKRFVKKYPVSSALSNMTSCLVPFADGNTAGLIAPISENPLILSRHIKKLGYFLRADIMGICRLPEYAVYAPENSSSGEKKPDPLELNHKSAILIVVDQDYYTMKGSSGHDWISGAQSFRGYSTTAFISSMLADYIRQLGYSAYAHHSGSYQVALPPLLMLSGIGEMSRISECVLNPFLGTRFKAAAVTTDMPLEPDKPIDFGLQKFCDICQKCAEYCPSKAITTGPKVMYNGYETWKSDIEKCAKFRIVNPNGSACGTCIKVCPWNKPKGWTHDLVRWLIEHAPVLNGMIVSMDTALGYGKQDLRYKWWFDLENVDGTLKIPGK